MSNKASSFNLLFKLFIAIVFIISTITSLAIIRITEKEVCTHEPCPSCAIYKGIIYEDYKARIISGEGTEDRQIDTVNTNISLVFHDNEIIDFLIHFSVEENDSNFNSWKSIRLIKD